MKSNIQKPLFQEAPITYRASFDLIEELTPILQNQIAKTKYDRVVIAEQFLEHAKGQNPFEALHTFSIDSSLSKTAGNSCVGLSLDLIERIGNRASPYLGAATLSDRYQQLAGPLYCHVTPLIHFSNPKDPKDEGYIILDPNFHIKDPILLLRGGPSFKYDMGGKKGIWTFSLEGDRILCRTDLNSQDSMLYRLDQIVNPINSSALPMFAIDRSYPIVARRKDGSQLAHLNMELTKKEMSWKIGNEKKEPIPFADILSGTFSFDEQIAGLFMLEKEALNHSIRRIAEGVDCLDEMYFNYLRLIENTSFFQSLLKTPYAGNHEPRTHHCRTLEPYLSLIRSGVKKIEGRVFSLKYQTFKPGDTLRLYNDAGELWCKLSAIRPYKTFRDMLLAEGLSSVVPNVSTPEEGVAVYASFPNYSEEKEYGVIALEVTCLG